MSSDFKRGLYNFVVHTFHFSDDIRRKIPIYRAELAPDINSYNEVTGMDTYPYTEADNPFTAIKLLCERMLEEEK